MYLDLEMILFKCSFERILAVFRGLYPLGPQQSFLLTHWDLKTAPRTVSEPIPFFRIVTNHIQNVGSSPTMEEAYADSGPWLWDDALFPFLPVLKFLDFQLFVIILAYQYKKWQHEIFMECSYLDIYDNFFSSNYQCSDHKLSDMKTSHFLDFFLPEIFFINVQIRIVIELW